MKDLITIHKEEGLETKELSGLYLIRNLDTNALKIGITNNLQSRFKDLIATFKHVGINPRLKVECFLECEIKVYTNLEKILHKNFKEYNIQNEWFDIDDINCVLEYTMSLDVNMLNNRLGSKYTKVRVIRKDGKFKIPIPKSIELKGNDLKIIPILCYLYTMTNRKGVSLFTIEDMARYMGYIPNRKRGKINDRIKEIIINLINMGIVCDIDKVQIEDCSGYDMMKCKLMLFEVEVFYLDINAVESICCNCGKEMTYVLGFYSSLLSKIDNPDGDILKYSEIMKDTQIKMSKDSMYKALRMLQELNLIELIN